MTGHCTHLPLFPTQMWKHPCAQVIFDSDPAHPGRPAAIQMEELSQAMIRYYICYKPYLETEIFHLHHTV